MKVTRVLGAKELKKTFREQSRYLGKGFEEGLVLGGLIIQAESMAHTPVDTGALRNSHRTTKTGGGFKTIVRVSCQTAYAIFVHENLEASHAAGTWAKFMTRAVEKKQKDVIAVIKQKMKD